MKLNDLKLFLNEENGQHTTNIYIPSIKREIALKPLTTANVKTLSRIGIFNEFDLNNELLKLSLFDKMSIETKESCGIDSESLTQIDFLSFLIGIRRLLDNTLAFSFTCQECEKEFTHSIDLEAEFSKYIFSYQRKQIMFEKIDNNDVIWKFELESYTMKDYLYYRYYIERLKEIDVNNPDLLNEGAFIRPVLYIRNIWRNEELIEDWKDQLLSAKIKLLNALPSEIILDVKNSKETDACLSNFIKDNFDEEKLFQDIEKIQVVCPNCGETYEGLFSFDDFFTF
jgi:hypothetical protein